MSERLDAVMLRKYTDKNTGETKSQSTKIGVAWPLSGGGYRVELEAMPVPTIYESKIQNSFMLFPPKDRQDTHQPSQPRQSASVPPSFDDDMPF